MSENLDTVKFSQIKKMVESLEKHPITKDRLDDLDVSFEFIIGSLFPTIFKKIQNELKDSFTKGYIAAKQEMENTNAD